MRIGRTLILAFAFGTLALPAIAASFTSMDTDKDGRVTRDEAEASQARQFDRLDTNKDGTLDLSERGGGRKAATPRADPVFTRADTDHDGKISLAELQAERDAMAQRRVAAGKQGRTTDMTASFRKRDTNGDGFIDQSEWEASRPPRAQRANAGVTRAAYVAQADRWMKRFDTNNDGGVTREEMRTAIAKWRARSSN